MRHCRKTSGALIGRVASSFSLLLAIAVAYGGPFGDLDAKLNSAHTDQEKYAAIQGAQIDDGQFDGLRKAANATNPASIERAVQYVSLKAIAEEAANPSSQGDKIKKIKSSTFYNDEGVQGKANWLSGALKRFSNLRSPRVNPSGTGMPAMAGWGGFAQFFVVFVWMLLGAAVVAFIIYAVRFISFGKLRKRGAKAMLEDSEPERSLDEWLTLAESFEREGRYREAVRALYLACLLKFDERNVARFMRGQTNWEHLARIESSPRLPADLDFRSATQSFDRIWYGHKVRGQEDVGDFKDWYGRITGALQGAAA